MSAAIIVFMDIVGFSKKPTFEQQRLVSLLNVEVIHEIRTLLLPPIGPPKVVALPTGDGMALCFLHDDIDNLDRLTIFNLICRIQKWAHRESNLNDSVQLRFGIHVGRVQLITDINGQMNVCGHTINYSQRVMDAANPKQLLFSEQAFGELIGQGNPVVELENGQEMSFAGPFEIFAKHGLQIPVYAARLNPDQDWWSNEDPVARHLMLVTLTPLPKEVGGTFADRLEEARQIALIQITGDRLLEKLVSGEITFSPELEKLWVFMPHVETYSSFHRYSSMANERLLNDSIISWKSYLTNLAEDHQNANIKLGLFRDPPFIGASFLDWDRPKGKIHVSPYVWNVEAPRCPGYDLEWIGSRPSNIYETYLQGLDYLNTNTSNKLIS